MRPPDNPGSYCVAVPSTPLLWHFADHVPMTTFAGSPMTTLIDLPVRYDLAESTAPPLRLGEIADPAVLADLTLGYGTSRGDAD
ncbi:hypothetical protein C1I95_26850 [Micromonospora craterilacus]|uniref:Uncharacterized protein n=2 Tax=Micromonospora craterilacus TaxID=1655439 RepID=A0A2W2E5P3_9ACTN|nr:hypothetical protein C1I95_26850 [Micromonospora craterilacus]